MLHIGSLNWYVYCLDVSLRQPVTTARGDDVHDATTWTARDMGAVEAQKMPGRVSNCVRHHVEGFVRDHLEENSAPRAEGSTQLDG